MYWEAHVIGDIEYAEGRDSGGCDRFDINSLLVLAGTRDSTAFKCYFCMYSSVCEFRFLPDVVGDNDFCANRASGVMTLYVSTISG